MGKNDDDDEEKEENNDDNDDDILSHPLVTGTNTYLHSNLWREYLLILQERLGYEYLEEFH